MPGIAALAHGTESILPLEHEQKLTMLRANLAALGSLLVAYSGGTVGARLG